MSCQNVCSGSKNMMSTYSSPRSPALGWGTVPGTGGSVTHTARGDPSLDGQKPQAALIAVAARPLQTVPEMAMHGITVREKVGEASRCEQGGWLLC